MTIKSVYQVQCVCGKSHTIENANQVFLCKCGRKQIIDFAAASTEAELIKLLDGVQVQAERLARVIEVRRDRRVA